MKNTKILNIVVGVVMLLGLFFWIRTGMNGDELEGNLELQASVLDPFSWLMYLLLIAAALISVGFSIKNLIRHPELLKRSLIGLAGMAVILLLAYVLSPDNVVTSIKGIELASSSVSKWVSTGIWYSLLLGAVGLLFFVYDFVKSFINN
ncbi:MAG: hypothetical protein L3J45_05115 [Flavobacteriaceae bacterium]|nr:hypothetical protein [Flavobacteriaceae bacterium]